MYLVVSPLKRTNYNTREINFFFFHLTNQRVHVCYLHWMCLEIEIQETDTIQKLQLNNMNLYTSVLAFGGSLTTKISLLNRPWCRDVRDAYAGGKTEARQISHYIPGRLSKTSNYPPLDRLKNLQMQTHSQSSPFIPFVQTTVFLTLNKMSKHSLEIANHTCSSTNNIRVLTSHGEG